MNISSKSLGRRELLGLAWDVFTKNIAICLKFTAIILVPHLVNILLFQKNWLISFLIAIVVSAFAAMFFIPLVDNAVKGKEIDFNDLIEVAKSKFTTAFKAILVIDIASFIFGLLLILPGVVYAVYKSMTLFMIALKDKDSKEARSASHDFVRGNWFKVLDRIVVIFIAYMIPAFALSIVLAFLLLGQALLTAIVAQYVTLLASCFGYIAYTLFFLNLEKTKSSGDDGLIAKIDSIMTR